MGRSRSWLRAFAAVLGVALALSSASTVAAAATMTLKPSHGPVTKPLTATYHVVTTAPCAGMTVRFTWDGALFANATLGASCTVSISEASARARRGRPPRHPRPDRAGRLLRRAMRARIGRVRRRPDAEADPESRHPGRPPGRRRSPPRDRRRSPRRPRLRRSSRPRPLPARRRSWPVHRAGRRRRRPAPSSERSAHRTRARPPDRPGVVAALGSVAPPGPGSGGPGTGGGGLPAMAAAVAGPEAPVDRRQRPRTNLILTVVVLLTFGLTSSLFNSTIKSNREQIDLWTAAGAHRIRPLTGPATAFAAGAGAVGRGPADRPAAPDRRGPRPDRAGLRVPQPGFRARRAQPRAVRLDRPRDRVRDVPVRGRRRVRRQPSARRLPRPSDCTWRPSSSRSCAWRCRA